MRLSRLGSLHQCRLSFMRQLTRRMAREAWTFSRPVFEIDENGVGHAVYSAKAPNHTYSLVAFAHDLPDDMRSDRVIAEAWDATFALFDGTPTKEDIERLQKNVPLQEAGRISQSELSLSRANRSVRLWTHVVDALASGRQPDTDQIDAVGYLMRTTAVYGSGKFGAADREMIAGRSEMQSPFQAEMLSVWLTRTFVRDLVQHVANAKGGDSAAQLDPAIARSLGIGNSTGLGMAPFIINHPVLFNNWITARETAIARVRALDSVSEQEVSTFRKFLKHGQDAVANWHSEHPIQIAKLKSLRQDIELIERYCEANDLTEGVPWDKILRWSETALSEEGQEFLGSLLLEPYGDLVDDLGDTMSEQPRHAVNIDGTMPVSRVMELIEATFGKELQTDWSDPSNTDRIWYVSEEKLEPRLGQRNQEPVGDYEQPLAPARDAAQAHAALAETDPAQPVAEFLLRHPEHRHTVRRAQITSTAPYAEIRDNTVSADLMPIDMLRAKLSFFGATEFDPRSDRWVRICMYAGAPFPEDLNVENADFWVFRGVVF